MELQELFEQNPWWKDKSEISNDYDIIKWNEKEYRWIPKIINKIDTKEYALHTILGPRQAGKTTAVKLLIKKLLNDCNPKSIFYFNCENLLNYKELYQTIEIYLEFKESNSIFHSIILLDEITLAKEWYRAVKSLIDMGKLKNDTIIITGSSSINVKKEVELFPGRRGNGKDYILYPLSFRDFVSVFDNSLIKKIPSIKNITDFDNATVNTILLQKELNKYLIKYMESGGFPLSVASINENKIEAKRTYLSWIKNAVLKADRSDIIARQIIKVLIETVGTPISYEGISKKIDIKSPKTALAYIELFKSIYAVNVLYNIDPSTKRIKFGKNKKIYIKDPLLFEIFEDWCYTKIKNKESAIAESLVVEHLERMFTENVFYWKNGFEIDAIVLDKDNLFGFEVKWAEKSDAKQLNQLKKFIIVTKKDYSKNPLKIPLSVFLALIDV